MSKRLVILGGGVVGLSIAWEALRRGYDVTVIDRSDLPGRASWAGAGILSPGHPENAAHPLERMAGKSNQIHRKWSADLQAETGLNNGLLSCGGVYLASTTGEAAALAGQMVEWQSDGIDAVALTRRELDEMLTPEFQPALEIRSAWYTPSETQICNTAHLDALTAAIEKRNGRIIRLDESTAESLAFVKSTNGNEVREVTLGGVAIPCDVFCLSAGAWSGQVGDSTGFHLPTTPVRGQMLLFQLPRREFVPIVNLGSRYIVPRADGRVLVGSTMEEAGFDASTSDTGVAGLMAFAASLFPVLNPSSLVRSWAGLRPASFDGMPYIGRVAPQSNTIVCTGHMRSGLQLSAASAVMVCDLIENRENDPDLMRLVSPLRISNRPA